MFIHLMIKLKQTTINIKVFSHGISMIGGENILAAVSVRAVLLLNKYNLKSVEIVGLLIGAQGAIPKLFFKFSEKNMVFHKVYEMI